MSRKHRRNSTTTFAPITTTPQPTAPSSWDIDKFSYDQKELVVKLRQFDKLYQLFPAPLNSGKRISGGVKFLTDLTKTAWLTQVIFDRIEVMNEVDKLQDHEWDLEFNEGRDSFLECSGETGGKIVVLRISPNLLKVFPLPGIVFWKTDAILMLPNEYI